MRTSCDENFSLIEQSLLELLPQNLQNWAQLGQEAKKIRGIRRVKSRTANIHRLN